MDDLIALIVNHAITAGLAFAGSVLIPAALLYARAKAKQTKNTVDDRIVDGLSDAYNKAHDKP